MNKAYSNIEPRKLARHHNYRVGYYRDGYAVRIYGKSGAWRVNHKGFATLADVSLYLRTVPSQWTAPKPAAIASNPR